MTNARSRLARWWRGESSIGFAVRFGVLAAVLFLVPPLLGFSADGFARYLPSTAAAAIVVAGYLVWPREALLAFACFMLFQETLTRWTGVPVRQIDEFSVPVLFLVAGLRAWRDWRAWWWWPREATIFIAVGFGIVSSLAASVPLAVWFPALGLLSKGVAFLYVAIWTGAPSWQIRAGMRIGLAIGLVVVGLSFVELLDPLGFQHALNLQEYYHPRGGLPAVKSLFYHPVLYAWFTAFMALFLYSYFVVTRRWWALGAAVLFSFGPFLAARRRAIIALAAGLGAGLASFADRVRSLPVVLRAWMPVTAAMVVVVVAFLPGLVALYGNALDRYVPSTPAPGETVAPTPAEGPVFSIEGDTNPQVRIALYVGSLKVARDYFPLGAGLGRYGSWMSRVKYSPIYAEYGLDRVSGLRPRNPKNVTDTFWPQILGELGVFGGIAYAGFLACLAWLLWRRAQEQDDRLLRVFALAAGMIFAQALVESLASPMFHSPARVYLTFLVVGLAIAMPRRPAPDG